MPRTQQDSNCLANIKDAVNKRQEAFELKLSELRAIDAKYSNDIRAYQRHLSKVSPLDVTTLVMVAGKLNQASLAQAQTTGTS